MAAAGVDIMLTSTDWGAIGLLDALKKLPRVWRAFRRLSDRLASERPSGLVLIDCGGLNMRVAQVARRLGLRTLYYLPPRSWSRRQQAGSLSELVDVVATPFPWSRDLLSGGSAQVHWVGHPAVEAVRPRLSMPEAWREYQLDPDRPVVALGPGSRDQEMRYVLPVLAKGGALLLRQHPELQFLVPVANPVYEKAVWDAFDRVGVRFTLLRGMDYDALQLARAAAVCSGTATLELACLRVPMVVVYRTGLGTTIQFLVLRGLLAGQWKAGMPNIIAGRDVVPELTWRHATPEAIASALGELLADSPQRERMQADLEEVVTTLGMGSASDRTADLVLAMALRGEESRGRE
jgi:lipid-A-disaccharide synthase